MAKFEPKRLTDYSEEALIAEIKRVANAKCGGRCPRPEEFKRLARVSYQTLLAHFETYEAAMARAGLKHEKFAVSTESMKQDLAKVLADNEGRYFTQEYYSNHGGKASGKTVRKRLGYKSWRDLLIGLFGISRPKKVAKPKRPKVVPPSRHKLLLELKRVWDLIGHQPTSVEFQRFKKNGLGQNNYKIEFKGWNKAILEACKEFGYKPQFAAYQTASSEDLIADLRRVLAMCPASHLKYRDYRSSGGKYPMKTFRRMFGGSWASALQQVGVHDGHRAKKYSNEDLFAEIQRVWELLGRQPTGREMRLHGCHIPPVTFGNRFGGTWLKAIHAFCEDRNRTDSDADENAGKPSGEIADSAPTASEPAPEPASIRATIDIHIPQKKRTPRAPSLRLRWKVFVRDHFRCVACGKSASDPDVRLEPDHIIPYSKDGETVLENLRLLCWQCNNGKSDLV